MEASSHACSSVLRGLTTCKAVRREIFQWVVLLRMSQLKYQGAVSEEYKVKAIRLTNVSRTLISCN